MTKRTHSGKTGSAIRPPADAAAGAAHIRAAAVKLYDRQDGTGADFRAVTEALFRAAFDTLDKLPDKACRAVAQRVHEGSYARLADGPRSVGAEATAGVERGQEVAHERTLLFIPDQND